MTPAQVTGGEQARQLRGDDGRIREDQAHEARPEDEALEATPLGNGDERAGLDHRGLHCGEGGGPPRSDGNYSGGRADLADSPPPAGGRFAGAVEPEMRLR
jgi:hypothetical protein